MLNAMTDRQLHEAYVAGDKRAATVLIRRHYPAILGYFRRKLPHLADDLTQKTFQVYVEGHDKVQRTNLRAYFYGVAKNKLLHALRSMGRHAEEELGSMSLLQAVGPGVETISGGGQEVRVFLQALQSIELRYHFVIELLLCGLSIEEVAEAMDVPLNTCRGWRRDGSKALRAKLVELGGSPQMVLVALKELGFEDWSSLRELVEEEDDE